MARGGAALDAPRGVIALAVVLFAAGALAQPTVRRATNLASLLNYPAFYQQRPVVLVGTVAMRDNGRIEVTDETGTLLVVSRAAPPDGLAEIRGEFWDLGRMNPDDPRLATIDIRTAFGIDREAPWPRAGQVMAVIATTINSITPPSLPTVRNMVLFPSRYREQKVTIVGQFAGRNLLGDLPDAPARSRYDFVLRSADAAVWVTNLRPRGKDFELALDARIDTGRWLEVTGTLQQGRGLQWLDAEAGSLKLTKAPNEQPEETMVRVPAAPPPEVVFSAPTEGETEVAPNTTIRIQFSRDINPATLKGRIKILYAAGSDAGTPISDFTTEYRGAARVLEVKFTKPLQALGNVRVSFDEGILGTDQQPLKAWTLAFAVAGG